MNTTGFVTHIPLVMRAGLTSLCEKCGNRMEKVAEFNPNMPPGSKLELNRDKWTLRS